MTTLPPPKYKWYDPGSPEIVPLPRLISRNGKKVTSQGELIPVLPAPYVAKGRDAQGRLVVASELPKIIRQGSPQPRIAGSQGYVTTAGGFDAPVPGALTIVQPATRTMPYSMRSPQRTSQPLPPARGKIVPIPNTTRSILGRPMAPTPRPRATTTTPQSSSQPRPLAS